MHIFCKDFFRFYFRKKELSILIAYVWIRIYTKTIQVYIIKTVQTLITVLCLVRSLSVHKGCKDSL